MNTEFHDPSGSVWFWTAVVIVFGVSAFFQISHDAELKRKLWPGWLVITGLLFTLFGWLVGGLPIAAVLLVGSVLFGILNYKRVQFCGSCGRTVNSFNLGQPPPTVCPFCSQSLGRAA